jgi:hypothetical protein
MLVRTVKKTPFLSLNRDVRNVISESQCEDCGRSWEPELPANEIPSVVGCLRGFGSAVALEAITGVLLFSFWYLRHLTR